MSGFVGYPRASLLDIRLQRQEVLDSRFGRFLAPEEQAFNTNLPSSERAVSYDTKPLIINRPINLTEDIMNSYVSLIPQFCF